MKLYSLIPAAVLLAAASIVGSMHASTVAAGGLVKGSLPAVYYIHSDGKRYIFPSDKTYFTWYADFSGVNKITDAELAAYTIGGNVTYRPGIKLVKIQSDPKVYAVAHGGVLRWISTEAAAVALYGANWNTKIDDLSDAFFTNYTVGSNISSAADYDPLVEQQLSTVINNDKGCSSSSATCTPPPDTNANTNTNVNTPVVTTCTPACGLGDACVENSCRAVPGPSALAVKAFIIDYVDTCFVGDACTGGSCCNVAGTSFADNANLKSVRPVDKYLYADKQQLCGRASVSAADRNRITTELNDFAMAAGGLTQNRMNISVSQFRFYGEQTMSRVPGTCSWWISPNDLRERLTPQIDSSTDSVFVISSRNFDFGAITTPDTQTVDQSSGLSGAGYSYFVKEWETDTTGAANHSAYTTAFQSQMDSSVDLGVTNPNMSYIGNHCRDQKRNFDEAGIDCGGLGCTACIN